MKIDHEVCERLQQAVERINVPGFADSDPVGYVKQFHTLPDVEISALLASTIAWGNRCMICRDCERMFDMMHWRPYDFMMSGEFRSLDPSQNLHRTFFVRDLQYYMEGLRVIYQKYGSLQAFVHAQGIGLDTEQPSWLIASALSQQLVLANDGETNQRCLPRDFATTALKRFNMALRWLVRNDGIVDLGAWDVISPAQLYIPLDVHVSRTARGLGLLTRRSNDRKAVIELTDAVRQLRPDDPAIFDFALFGLGMEAKSAK